MKPTSSALKFVKMYDAFRSIRTCPEIAVILCTCGYNSVDEFHGMCHARQAFPIPLTLSLKRRYTISASAVALTQRTREARVASGTRMDNLPSDEDIILASWEGKDEARAQLLMKHAGALQVAIRRAYPIFDEHEAEDVVSEGIRRFWEVRERCDDKRDLCGFVYGFVKNVAREHAGCSLNWQKTRSLEVPVEAALVGNFPSPKLEDDLDKVENDNTGILKAIKKVLDRMNPILREVWLTHAFAREDVNAARLGEKLGNEFKSGVPIPAGTIRVYKTRAIAFVKQEIKKLGFEPDTRRRRR